MSSKAERAVDEAAQRILADSRDEQDRALRVAVLTTAINVTDPRDPLFLRQVLARAYAFHAFIVGQEPAPTVH
jgi:hypothetical protein